MYFFLKVIYDMYSKEDCVTKDRSKRMQAVYKDLSKTDFNPSDAFDVLKERTSVKFDESVDVNLTLGIDGKQSDQVVRGFIALPHGLGKNKKVAVFCKAEEWDMIKSAGADFVGLENLVEEFKSEKIDCDVCITNKDSMPYIMNISKILGQRGLMPNAKSGTLTENLVDAVKAFKKGVASYRSDKSGNISTSIGKVSFDTQSLLSNMRELIQSILSAKPKAIKVDGYIKSIFVSSTMGPGLKITASEVMS